MIKLQEVINKLIELGEDVDFYGGNNIDTITQVEKSLDISCDYQLKKFLEEYGGGGIVDIISTNGILPFDPLSENLFTLLGATLYARKEYKLEKKYLVINSDFPEKCWVIDTINSENNPVYSFDTINSKIVKLIYKDFNDYIYSEFNEYLKEIL